jgi:integrase
MGLGSKKMIYEVYGDYIEGLEEILWEMLEYYGRDFAEPKKKQSATVGYSQTIPFPLQPTNLPQQNETLNLL